jgi:deoxyribodipyrimidine photolyase-related protein
MSEIIKIRIMNTSEVKRFKVLRLILGDQLNYQHSWFQKVDNDVLYTIMEMRQETDYVRHHIQKIIAFFASMYNFASWLSKKGHKVHHIMINDPENRQSLEANLNFLISKYNIERFEYILPDEYRPDRQLVSYCNTLRISTQVYDSEHFMTKRSELVEVFGDRKQFLMESFYRYMRKKYQILTEGDGLPVGGKWNFDAENRSAFNKGLTIPEPLVFQHEYSKILREINKADIDHFGVAHAEDFPWPTCRKEALAVMNYFNEKLLPWFGKYQDAMLTTSPSLFHSRISFALNVKMLSPSEVIESAITTWQQHPELISLSQIEGYVRQIMGWREYMRGIYWAFMPEYKSLNYFSSFNALPDWFWTGQTQMNCMHYAITQSLETAYAHHIQRLMLTGNFTLLASINPDEVDKWYLGIYIDALEWVQLPNTRGMSQYADGGIVGSKPYVSTANYIHKMSDYCSKCRYDRSKRTGPDACPFNSLYWDFYIRNEDLLSRNPRIGMAYNQIKKMDASEKSVLQNQADYLMNNLNNL